jgi:hypothetical protein
MADILASFPEGMDDIAWWLLAALATLARQLYVRATGAEKREAKLRAAVRDRDRVIDGLVDEVAAERGRSDALIKELDALNRALSQ